MSTSATTSLVNTSGTAISKEFTGPMSPGTMNSAVNRRCAPFEVIVHELFLRAYDERFLFLAARL